MAALIADYWPIVLAALLAGSLTAWWIRGRSGLNVSLRDDTAGPATRSLQKGSSFAETSPPLVPPPAALTAELMRIKGVGLRMASLFATLGITRIGQLAELTDDDIARIDARAGPFVGRIERDRMVEQARLLASGDFEGYEAIFGRIEEPTF